MCELFQDYDDYGYEEGLCVSYAVPRICVFVHTDETYMDAAHCAQSVRGK